ncbi:hypothetical protein [Nitrosopumilus adriaticus]|uniref:hypothetical protein n=1 Tax=Nitrosopumilus adriaticus TaxID=1580092 RepID=UPI00064FFE2A|nr:hypothetical protein [Nitrosopumilus adriaticus]
MKNALCKKCLKKFQQKEIFTIQQFQYRKIPTYSWSLDYFKKLGIDEWDSFCSNCILEYSKKSKDEWNKLKV